MVSHMTGSRPVFSVRYYHGDTSALADLLVAGRLRIRLACVQVDCIPDPSESSSILVDVLRAPGVVERLASRLSLLDRVTLYRMSPDPERDGPLATFLAALCPDKACLRVSRNESYTEPADCVRLHHYAQHQPSTLFAYGKRESDGWSFQHCAWIQYVPSEAGLHRTVLHPAVCVQHTTFRGLLQHLEDWLEGQQGRWEVLQGRSNGLLWTNNCVQALLVVPGVK